MGIFLSDGKITVITLIQPSSRIEVMKMQYELLRDKFDNQETNASAVGLIKNMADGTRTHHANAFKFGLREGFSRTKPTSTEPAPAPQPFVFASSNLQSSNLQSSASARKPAGRFR